MGLPEHGHLPSGLTTVTTVALTPLHSREPPHTHHHTSHLHPHSLKASYCPVTVAGPVQWESCGCRLGLGKPFKRKPAYFWTLSKSGIDPLPPPPSTKWKSLAQQSQRAWAGIRTSWRTSSPLDCLLPVSTGTIGRGMVKFFYSREQSWLRENLEKL